MSLNIWIEDAGQLVARALLDPFTRVEDLKHLVEAQIRIPAENQRLFYRGQELVDAKMLDDFGIATDSVLTLVVRQRSALREAISPYGPLPCPPALQELMERAKQGIAAGLPPKLSEEGIGGTYFLRDPNEKIVAVFKPADEEAFCPNNPKNYVGEMDQEGLRPGIRSGEGSVREVAAYLLDHGGLADVPMTIRAEMPRSVFQKQSGGAGADMAGPGMSSRLELSQLGGSGGARASSNKGGAAGKGPAELPTKIGSLQEFVAADDVASDISPTKFSVAEVHKIAILDMRLLNTDRNDGNILVKYECDSPRNKPAPVSGNGSAQEERSARISPRSLLPGGSHRFGSPSSPPQHHPQHQQHSQQQQQPVIVGTPLSKPRVFDGLLSSRHRSPSTISASVKEEDAESLAADPEAEDLFGQSVFGTHRSPSQPLAIPGRAVSPSLGLRPGMQRAVSTGSGAGGHTARRPQPLHIPGAHTNTHTHASPGQPPHTGRSATASLGGAASGPGASDFSQLQVGSSQRFDNVLLSTPSVAEDPLLPLIGEHLPSDLRDLDDEDADVSFFFAAMASSDSSPPNESNPTLMALGASRSGHQPADDSFEEDSRVDLGGRARSGAQPIQGSQGRASRSGNGGQQYSVASSVSSVRSGATQHPWLPSGMRARLGAETSDELSSDGSRTPLGGNGPPGAAAARYDEPAHPLMIQGARRPMGGPAVAAQRRAMARLTDEDEMGFLGKSAPVHAASPLLMGRMDSSGAGPRGWGAYAGPGQAPPGMFSPGMGPRPPPQGLDMGGSQMGSGPGDHPSPPGAAMPVPSMVRGVSALSSTGLLTEGFEAELASRRSSQRSDCARDRGGKCGHRRVRLIPIDHSNSLPDTMGITWADWVWLDWPQAKEPLSPEMRAYIEAMDIERDVELLRATLSIREPCLRLMRISNMLLQKGVRAGLSLYDIAKLICREDMDRPSQLEIACWHALALARANNKKMSLTVGGNTVVANLPDFQGAFRRRRAHSLGSLMDMNINMEGFGLSDRDKEKAGANNGNNGNGNGNSGGNEQHNQHGKAAGAEVQGFMRGRSKQFEQEVAEIEGRMFFLSLDTTLDHLLDLVKALKSRREGAGEKPYTPAATFTPALTPTPGTPNSVSSLLLGHGSIPSGGVGGAMAVRRGSTASTMGHGGAPPPPGRAHLSRELSVFPRGADSFSVGAPALGGAYEAGSNGSSIAGSSTRASGRGRRSIVGASGPSGIFHEVGPQDWCPPGGDPCGGEDDLELPVGSAPVPVLVPHLLSQRHMRHNNHHNNGNGGAGSQEAAGGHSAQFVESLYGPGPARSRASSVSAHYSAAAAAAVASASTGAARQRGGFGSSSHSSLSPNAAAGHHGVGAGSGMGSGGAGGPGYHHQSPPGHGFGGAGHHLPPYSAGSPVAGGHFSRSFQNLGSVDGSAQSSAAHSSRFAPGFRGAASPEGFPMSAASTPDGLHHPGGGGQGHYSGHRGMMMPVSPPPPQHYQQQHDIFAVGGNSRNSLRSPPHAGSHAMPHSPHTPHRHPAVPMKIGASPAEMSLGHAGHPGHPGGHHEPGHAAAASSGARPIGGGGNRHSGMAASAWRM